MAVIQPRPILILYQCAKCGDDRTSFNVICDVCETIKTGASREMTSPKIRRYLTLTCKTPIPKLLILIKLSMKI